MHLQQLKEMQKKMVYKRVRGWTSGQGLAVQKFVEHPPGMDGEWGKASFLKF